MATLRRSKTDQEGLGRRVAIPRGDIACPVAALRAWPHLRRVEADLVVQLRQQLGASQFDQAFSAGSRLTQRQAVTIARDQPGTGTQTP